MIRAPSSCGTPQADGRNRPRRSFCVGWTGAAEGHVAACLELVEHEIELGPQGGWL